MKKNFFLFILILFCVPNLLSSQQDTITVKSDKVIRKIKKPLLFGVNIAIWNNAETLKNEKTRSMFRDAKIGLIRIPGGSASDQYFWNGNKVRRGNNSPDAIDTSRYNWKTRTWNIDYSEWAPGFIGYWGFPENPQKAQIGTWHGNSDVKDHLEFIKSVGAEPLICVNAGTGSVKDAAEWVKWANKKTKYHTLFWEIGNELDGGWESGNIRPDGRKMNGKIYSELFLSFAKEMKKIDPNILIGGPAGGAGPESLIKDLLTIAGKEVGFISYHDYYTSGAGTIEEMFDKLNTIKKNISAIKKLVKEYQPQREKEILIGLTEWNCKLFEDEHTRDLFSGLWVASAFGEMAESDIDYATFWDSFTAKPESGGGHGFIIENTLEPLASFHMFNLLGQHYGDTILEVENSNPLLKVYSSKDSSGKLFLLVVNTSITQDIKEKISLEGFSSSPVAKVFRFSTAEYRWNGTKNQTEWNNGPSEMLIQAQKEFEYNFPSFSAFVFEFSPAGEKKESLLSVLGKEETVVPVSSQVNLKVLLTDSEGNGISDAKISVTSDNNSLIKSPLILKTSKDGTAILSFTAPKEETEGKIIFSSSEKKVEHTVKTKNVKLKITGPSEKPKNEPFTIEVAATFEDNNKTKIFDSLPYPCTLNFEKQSLTGDFKQGVAKFVILPQNTGLLKLEAKAGIFKTDNPLQIRIFEEKEQEKVILQFDELKDMKFVSGECPGEIDLSVRANQGVLKVPLKDYQGWTQNKLNLKDFNSFKNVNWAKVNGVFFDIMLSPDFDSNGDWAQMVFALQSSANYWMPLKEVSLTDLPKGEWKKIILKIDKKEWQEAMAHFYQIIVIFNSSKKIKGTLYLDNIGFIEKTEAK